MFNFNITDRRLNPHGKSLNNRQRFVERVKGAVKTAANKQIKSRSIDDKSEAEIGVSRDGIDEPQFRYSTDSGSWDHVLPGNHEYNVGDTIPRPPGGGSGRGSEGATDGEGEDDFRFYITYEEYINAILGDLSLPDMIKSSQKELVSYSMRRAGYTRVGITNNLALERTMIQGIGRRIALKNPKLTLIVELTAELAETVDLDRRLELEEQIANVQRQADAICFLEKADLRYVNFTKQANPISQAVMFAAMDVSGSMTEHMKDLAKRFYLLLYVFLTRQYQNVDIVFIRHTHQASEVDQDTFFNSPETGGTVVSTAYHEIQKIIRDRYSVADWNIYLAQASDGDNSGADFGVSKELLTGMLPWMQYVTYVEVGVEAGLFHTRESDLWKMFKDIGETHKHVAARKLTAQANVVEVFRSLFKKQTTATVSP
jgi:uncharacterized sporulation protein YeaH/YhbH (DUF444 family)